MTSVEAPSRPAGKPPRPRATLAVLAALILAAALVGAVRYVPLTVWGRTLIERRLDGLQLGAFGRLRIEGLRGDVWNRVIVKRITLADQSGVWLEAHDTDLTWRPSALWRRRVEVASVTSPDVTVWREPMLTAQSPLSRSTLPISLQLDRALVRLTLAPAFAGRKGVYHVGAALRLDRSGAVRGSLDALSLLHPGDFLSARLDIGHKDRLTVLVRALEAQGGPIAGVLGLPTDKPLTVDVRANGRGKVGRFTAVARVGDTQPAEAGGSWSENGGQASGRFSLAASRRLSSFQIGVGPELRFDVTGRAVKPGVYAMIINVVGANLNVTARGDVDPGRQRTGSGGVQIDLRIADSSKMVGTPGLGAGRFQGTVEAAANLWVLNGLAAIDHVVLADYSLARVWGPIKLEANKNGLTLQGAVRGAGGAGKGLAAALLGATPNVAAEVAWLPDGRALIRRFSVDAVGVKGNARGDQGLLGGLSFTGDAAFSRLAAAQVGARGLITTTWTASQRRAGDRWSFSFDAKGHAVSTGSASADRYIGPTPHVTAKGEYSAGNLSIANSTMDGAAGSLSAAGIIEKTGNLRLNLAWRSNGPLSLGPLDITGSARGEGAVTGALAAPRADLTADFKAIDLPYLPLQNAHLILSFLRTPQGSDGRIVVTGASDYGLAKGAAAFRFVDNGIDISGLELDAGGVRAHGSVNLRDSTPSAANLAVTVGVGAFLAQGRAEAKVVIVDAAGGARATVNATMTDAILRDGGGLINTLAVSADGPLRRLSYSVKGAGDIGEAPWRIAGGGVLTQGVYDQSLSFTGTGRYLRADLKTVEPAKATFFDNGMDAILHLSSGNGHMDVSFDQRGGTVKAAATLSDLSLALLNPDYVGRLDGAVTLAGHGGPFSGTLDAKLTGAGGRDLKGSPPLDGTLKATLAGSTLSLAADVANTAGSKAHINLTLPAESSTSALRIAVNRTRPMAGRFEIDGEIRPLWDLVLGGGRSLSGHVRAAGSVIGSLADPRFIGRASLENGRFQDSDTGLKLEGVMLTAALQDNSIDISRFSGRDNGRGAVAGSGRISLFREGKSNFQIDLRGFRLIDNDIGVATATGVIKVVRAADGKVQLSGDLNIDRAQIAPNPPVPSGVVPMDVVERHKPVDLNAPAIVVARESPVNLDIKLKAPGGVFIKGRGLNVELSLDAKVSGTTNEPQLSGVAHVVRGDYDFAGRRFQFDDRGVVYLGSTPETIRLDLTATREDPSLTAVIKITGTAAKPTVALSSTPVLPKDEVLSQVLFGASASQLSGLQAAQLASALSGLAGGGGFDIIGGLRNFAHLDRLAVSGDATSGTSVSGGKYLTDKVYLEISGGGREGPGAQVEWRVRRHLAIISRVTSQGDSQISVRWRKN